VVGFNIICADVGACVDTPQKRDWKIAKVGHSAVKDRSAVVAKNDVITLTPRRNQRSSPLPQEIRSVLGARGDLVVVAQHQRSDIRGAQCQTKAWTFDFDAPDSGRPLSPRNNVRSFGGVDFVAIKGHPHDIIAATCGGITSRPP